MADLSGPLASVLHDRYRLERELGAGERRLFMFKLSIILVAFALLSQRAALAQAPHAVPAPQHSVTLPPALDRVLRDYEREWQARSATGLAALFVDDGFVLQPGQPPVRGRAGIAAAYRGAGGPLALRALAFGAADTVGCIIGAYSSEPGSPDVGKFILVLRRESGQPWRILADMDNGNGLPSTQRGQIRHGLSRSSVR